MTTKLYYIYDPMCSWCWGFRPIWDQVQTELGDNIEVVNLVGGLASDSDQPMPLELQSQIKGHWRRIQELLGTEFNFDFWILNQPRRSTFDACRAVLAARSFAQENAMIDAIQRGYYLQAKNPSDRSVLLHLAKTIGLDAVAVNHLMDSEELNRDMSAEFKLVRQLPIDGFPSLVLESDGQWLPIKIDYKNAQPILDQLTFGS